MSGGSYDYVYHRIADIEIRHGHERKFDDDKYNYAMIESQYNKRKKEMIMDIKQIPERVWFQGLLKLVAEVMHDIEWVDSGDYAPGDEFEAIQKCKDYLKGE